MDTIIDRDSRVSLPEGANCNVLIDGHVHIHECFALTELLDAAAANFAEASREIGLAERAHYVLLLCDTSAQHSFSDLRLAAESTRLSSGWSFCRKNEPTVVAAVRDDDTRLLLLAGRQVQTREGLEVLTLCTNEEISDGLETAETIAAAQNAGAIPVLPWGFGKWHGKRGDLVNDLIHGEEAHRLVLGDNSGRLAVLREPSQFRVARALGMKILAGTDALPFRDQQRRVGGYGSHFYGPFDEDSAAQSIRSLLYDELGQLIKGRLDDSRAPVATRYVPQGTQEELAPQIAATASRRSRAGRTMPSADVRR